MLQGTLGQDGPEQQQQVPPHLVPHARTGRALAVSLASCGLYGGAAISMNFVNKASLRMLPLPHALLLLQMMATLLVLHCLQVLRGFV